MRTSITRRRLLCAAVSSFVLPGHIGAQTRYPRKPVNIIVPFVPGGSADIFARSLGRELTARLGQPVLIINKPGAGGNLGAAEVARSGADGHTLLYSTAAIAVNQTLYPNTNGFRLFKDLLPVAIVAVMPHILVIKKSLPIRTTQELLALLHANPGKYNYASAGSGTSSHLSAELFKKNTSTSAVHVPYRGGAQAMMAVLSEEVDFALLASFQVLPQLKAGRVNALATTAMNRSPSLPLASLPTLRAEGVDVESYQWHGLFVSSDVNKDIVQTLHHETQSWLAESSTIEKIHADGSEPMPTNLEQTYAFVRAEVDKWAAVVKFSGAKPE
jgi:tripartite-type tricarboxylate transporter receptor subunit TctC